MASGTIKAVVAKSDIVNDLTTNDSTKVLSAAQGYALSNQIGTLNNKIENIEIDTLHVSDSINVPANGLASAQFSIPGKSGYSLAGCLLMCSNNYITTGFAKVSGSYYYTLANGYTSALTTSLDAVLFYKKNS